ncbi:enhanced intracellular survival protein Eis [soil metagenome]
MPDQLDYRFAREDETGDLGRLIAHSFPGPARPPGFWKAQLGRPVYGGGAETLFVGTDAGRPVAALQLHPLHQWVGGEALPTAGVGTVAVAPTHRRRRIGAELMLAALRAARARGDIASALYPFRTSFYGNLGYGQAGAALQYQVPPGALPDSPERRRIELLEDEQVRAEALDLYGQWARTQNGQLERTARMWQATCAAPDTALVGYRSEEGALEGYAFVVYRTDLPLRDRFLEVDELVWTTPRARHGLYAWLASLGDQWQQLLIRALPSQHLGDWIREPRLPAGAAPLWRLWAPAATLMLGPMFRLLDVRAAWERRRIVAGPSMTVAMEVSDAQFPGNSGLVRLGLDGGRVSVLSDGQADLTLRLDVSTLSRLYAGSLTPTAALSADLLECDRRERLTSLDTALALPEPWTFDRF